MSDKNKFKIIIFIVGIIIFSVVIFFINNNEKDYNQIYIDSIQLEENVTNTVIEAEATKIKIHIIGEVKNPGIYELEVGSRIFDAVEIAGGNTEMADLNKINLAYELEDGQKIKIPGIFEEETAYIYNDSGENVIVSNDSTSNSNKKININKANIEELQKINGVGPSLAEKIIMYRNQNGKFKSIEDLKNVSGIGDKKYETIKEYVVVK